MRGDASVLGESCTELWLGQSPPYLASVSISTFVDGGLWVDSGPMVSSVHRQSDARRHGEIEDWDVSGRAEGLGP
jgi:hypothetical protein